MSDSASSLDLDLDLDFCRQGSLCDSIGSFMSDSAPSLDLDKDIRIRGHPPRARDWRKLVDQNGNGSMENWQQMLAGQEVAHCLGNFLGCYGSSCLHA